MQRLNFFTSLSSRRCNRVLRCRSSASQRAIRRRTSPGRWTGFLFHKTTGRTRVILFARDISSRDKKKRNAISKFDPPTVLLFRSFVRRKFMVLKIDGRCTRRLFAVINPGVLHEIVGKSVWSFHPTEVDPVGEPR